ncbi:MAG TPA: hypothetical protein DEA38_17505 [Stenotrophomonas sp.]|nr:hypothetical protein [Stenotrophomonas sp.]
MSVSRLLRSPCLFIFIACTAGVDSAAAEGRCPAGQYPIGDQGVGGCAPIPGAGQSAPEENPGYWVKTWGAVASSPTGDAGSATGHQAKASAERQALERCGLGGATDCRVVFTYYNQCYAAVGAARPHNGVKFSTGATKQQAQERAIQECRGTGSQKCTVIHSDCTKAYFQEG